MDRNSVVGYVLIAIVLVTFYLINRPSAEQIAEQARIRDSIAYMQQLDLQVAELEKQMEQQRQDSIQMSMPQRQEEFKVLENEVLKLTFSNKGGKIYKAELKDYQRFGDSINPLCLFEGDEYRISYTFITKNNHRIETDKTYFDYVATDNPYQCIARLPLDSTAWIDFVYTMKENDYMIDFQIVPHNTKEALAQNINYIPILWVQDIPQQEKGRKFEERYARLQYMFSGNDMETLSESKAVNKRESGHIKWIAYKDQFFATVMIAQESFQSPTFESQPQNRISGYIKHYQTTTQTNFDPSGSKTTNFRYYLGPNHYNTLRAYDNGVEKNDRLYLKELVPLGWKMVSWINKVFVIPLFDLLSARKLNIGLIILLITIAIKIIILPFVFASYKSSAKMRVLKPQIDEINEKYPPEKMQERQQATMALYNRAGVNPMSGCLPLLFQMPVVMAVFWFFPTAIELRGQSFLWAEDLSTYDTILSWNRAIPLFGDHLSLFCLLMTVVNIVYTYINMQSQSMGNDMKVMKWMMYFMPFMFLFIFNDYPAGLSFYYFVSLLLTIIQTMMFRLAIDDKKLLEQMEKNAQKNVGKKKSGWMERLEKMQREQQQMMRENAKKNRR